MGPSGSGLRRQGQPAGGAPPGPDFLKSLTREVLHPRAATSRVRLFKKSDPGGGEPSGSGLRRQGQPRGWRGGGPSCSGLRRQGQPAGGAPPGPDFLKSLTREVENPVAADYGGKGSPEGGEAEGPVAAEYGARNSDPGVGGIPWGATGCLSYSFLFVPFSLFNSFSIVIFLLLFHSFLIFYLLFVSYLFIQLLNPHLYDSHGILDKTNQTIRMRRKLKNKRMLPYFS